MDWQLDCYLLLCSLHCVLLCERGILSKCDMYEFGNVIAYYDRRHIHVLVLEHLDGGR